MFRADEDNGCPPSPSEGPGQPTLGGVVISEQRPYGLVRMWPGRSWRASSASAPSPMPYAVCSSRARPRRSRRRAGAGAAGQGRRCSRRQPLEDDVETDLPARLRTRSGCRRRTPPALHLLRQLRRVLHRRVPERARRAKLRHGGGRVPHGHYCAHVETLDDWKHCPRCAADIRSTRWRARRSAEPAGSDMRELRADCERALC